MVYRLTSSLFAKRYFYLKRVMIWFDKQSRCDMIASTNTVHMCIYPIIITYMKHSSDIGMFSHIKYSTLLFFPKQTKADSCKFCY